VRDIVILSTADWDNPYWTNKQHVAVELARLGNRILYIDSLGIRQPVFSRGDLRRIYRRLKRGVHPPEQVRKNLWVWSPLAVPLQRFATIRLLNRYLLRFWLQFWLRKLGFGRPLLWTYSPLTLQLLGRDAFNEVVYHSVDDIAEQPGMPKQVIRAAEGDLVASADVVFVTSLELLDRHKAINLNTHYLPNVCDYEHFARARDDGLAEPADISSIPPPRIGFVGAVSSYKLDLNLIREIATERAHWSFVFVGEIGEGDPWTNLETLRGLPNVHFMGGRPYADLPAYLKAFDVAILPSALNDYTKAMFPMKFFEYLAAGLPVVSTPLPALAEYGSVATFCGDSASFVEAIERDLRDPNANATSRQNAARENTYASRTKRMLDILGISGSESIDERPLA
jgi:glycosyltransferase involved in cell wall biosynthesis